MFSFLNNNPSNETNSLDNRKIPVVFPKIDDLPKSAQGYSTNNKYPNFPPLMCDGRCVQASWQPEAQMNNSILKQNGIRSNWEYRQYLTANAPEIMRQNFIESATDIGYYDRNFRDVASSTESEFRPILATATSHPFLYATSLDQPAHLGNISTDLQANYLSREQLAAQQFAPVITQDQLIRMKQSGGFH